MNHDSWDARMDGDMVIAGLSERTREAYLEAANKVLRKPASEFGAARLVLEEVERELDLADALRTTASGYVAGFKAFQPKLRTLEAVKTWVRREHRKANDLGERCAANAKDIQKAVAKLEQGST